MSEPVAHGSETANGFVQVVGFRDQHLPVDAQLSARREHERDFLERETRGASHSDEGQPLQHILVE